MQQQFGKMMVQEREQESEKEAFSLQTVLEAGREQLECRPGVGEAPRPVGLRKWPEETEKTHFGQ